MQTGPCDPCTSLSVKIIITDTNLAVVVKRVKENSDSVPLVSGAVHWTVKTLGGGEPHGLWNTHSVTGGWLTQRLPAASWSWTLWPQGQNLCHKWSYINVLVTSAFIRSKYWWAVSPTDHVTVYWFPRWRQVSPVSDWPTDGGWDAIHCSYQTISSHSASSVHSERHLGLPVFKVHFVFGPHGAPLTAEGRRDSHLVRAGNSIWDGERRGRTSADASFRLDKDVFEILLICKAAHFLRS